MSEKILLQGTLNPNGNFPTHDSNHGLGGLYGVRSLADMYKIPLKNRRVPMFCLVENIGGGISALYQLITNPTTAQTTASDWKIIPIGSVVEGGIKFMGSYNAAAPEITLVDGTGTNGHFYIVSNAGTVNFGSGNITFNVGDWVIYDGAFWREIRQQSSVSWDTLSGKPLTFPPDPHTHNYNELEGAPDFSTLVAKSEIISTVDTTTPGTKIPDVTGVASYYYNKTEILDLITTKLNEVNGKVHSFTFTGDGVTTTFTVPNLCNGFLFVEIAGRVQLYTTNYTTSGRDINFVVAPPLNEVGSAVYFEALGNLSELSIDSITNLRKELSETAIPEWIPKTYEKGFSTVQRNDLIYCVNTALPFLSSSFSTELSQGKWRVIGGIGQKATITLAGVSRLSVAPMDATDPIVVGDNDSRLSDSRTPTVHKSTHATGGTDALTPADIGAEPAFTKNTGFNLPLGNTSGTVAAGNHTHPVIEKVFFNSDFDTSSVPILYEGGISSMSVVLPAAITAVSYRVKLDSSTTWTTQANLTDLQTWINTNVTTSTKWNLIFDSTITSGAGEVCLIFKYSLV